MKKILLILFFVGLFAGTGCAFTSPVADTNQPPVITNQAVSPEAQKPAAEAQVPALQAYTITADQYSFSFNYPGAWPNPVMLNEKVLGNGQYPAREEANWRLNVGAAAPAACEGKDCYNFYFDGLEKSDQEKVIKELSAEALVSEVKTADLNGYPAVTYQEGGICGSKAALIFAQNYIVRFTGRCGADNQEIGAAFDQILSSFKLGETPFADWQTFTDADLNFSLKYPAAWTAERLNAQSGAVDVAGTKLRLCAKTVYPDCSHNLTIETGAKANFSYYGDSSIKVKSTKMINLVGVEATAHHYSGPYGEWYSIIVIDNRNIKYLINYAVTDEAEKAVMEQILSQFSLINK